MNFSERGNSGITVSICVYLPDNECPLAEIFVDVRILADSVAIYIG